MRNWIPVSTSPKGRLALVAVEQFGTRPFDEVTVGELATAANVTTGAIYHHFDSKLGLYAFVRADVEQRLLDRMAGAIAAAEAGYRSTAMKAALLVGFDFAVSEGYSQLLGTPPAGAEGDRLAEALNVWSDTESYAYGRVVAALWRAALSAVAEGGEPESARAVLLALELNAPGRRRPTA